MTEPLHYVILGVSIFCILMDLAGMAHAIRVSRKDYATIFALTIFTTGVSIYLLTEGRVSDALALYLASAVLARVTAQRVLKLLDGAPPQSG